MSFNEPIKNTRLRSYAFSSFSPPDWSNLFFIIILISLSVRLCLSSRFVSDSHCNFPLSISCTFVFLLSISGTIHPHRLHSTTRTQDYVGFSRDTSLKTESKTGNIRISRSIFPQWVCFGNIFILKATFPLPVWSCLFVSACSCCSDSDFVYHVCNFVAHVYTCTPSAHVLFWKVRSLNLLCDRFCFCTMCHLVSCANNKDANHVCDILMDGCANSCLYFSTCFSLINPIIANIVIFSYQGANHPQCRKESAFIVDDLFSHSAY